MVKLPASGEPSATDRVEQRELKAWLLLSLNSLDPESRALLVLRDMNGLDYLQIGEVFDIPVGTVKSRLFRARAALRSALEIEVERHSNAGIRVRNRDKELGAS